MYMQEHREVIDVAVHIAFEINRMLARAEDPPASLIAEAIEIHATTRRSVILVIARMDIDLEVILGAGIAHLRASNLHGEHIVKLEIAESVVETVVSRLWESTMRDALECHGPC